MGKGAWVGGVTKVVHAGGCGGVKQAGRQAGRQHGGKRKPCARSLDDMSVYR